MRLKALYRNGLLLRLALIFLISALASRASAIPSFQSINNALPNPDRAYEMTSGTAHYGNSLFSLYDLTFQVKDPSQLDIPTPRSDGRLEFDSTFEITYTAVISRGLEPSHPVSGIGTARAIGVSRPNGNGTGDFAFFNPEVFDTELVSLNLFALSPIPEVMFRESPTLHSTGVTIRENQCLVCATAFTFWHISSFFDAFTEYTLNGGTTWYPADKFIHLEQAPDGFPPGDYNQDKQVDAGDYDVWRNTLGSVGAGLDADGNWSGRVDTGDYIVWRANAASSSVSGSSSGAAIPEPAAVSLLIFAMSTLLIRRHTY